MTCPAYPKLLYIVSDLEIGGVERLVTEWARSLHGAAAECIVLCIGRKKGPLIQPLEQFGIAVDELSQAELPAPAFFLKLLRFVRQNRIAIAHSQCPWALPIQALAARIGGACKFILTIHSTYAARSRVASLRRRFLMRMARPWISQIVAVSEEVRRHSLDWLGLNEKEIVTIHNGINTERFCPALDAQAKVKLREQLGIPADFFVVGNVGGLRIEKDHSTLLEAICDLSQIRPFLVLVGDGPERSRIETMVASLGIGNRVLLLGGREDVPDILRALDAYVSSSQREGCSLAICEAMATGLPVVATAVGGTVDVIRHEQNGILVPPGDAAAIAAALRRIHADLALSSRLGLAARETILSHFSWDQCLRAYRKLYLGQEVV